MINNDKLIPYLYEGVYVVDTSRKIVFWNEGSERITGYKAEDVVNKHCYNRILQHIDQNGKDLCFEGCPLHHTLLTGKINEAHVFLKHKEGYRVPVMIKSIPIYDEELKVVAAIEVFTDERFLNDIYKENIELKDKLTKDPLTKIANRQYFDFLITKSIDEAHRFQKKFGILMIDIDHFKKVNDNYGHLIGDEVLKVVANSLSANLKRNDIISRWGGEEFVGILEVDSVDEIFEIAERLRRVIEKSSYKINEETNVCVTISLGGTIFKKNDDAKSMLDKADKNMYFAKQNGRNQSKVE